MSFLSKMKPTPAFKKAWMSDPATYPLLVVITGALGVAAFFGGRKLIYDPDVCIKPSNRMSFYPSALQVQNSKTWVKQDNLIKPMVQTLARGVDRTKMVPMADHFTETGAKSFF